MAAAAAAAVLSSSSAAYPVLLPQGLSEGLAAADERLAAALQSCTDALATAW